MQAQNERYTFRLNEEEEEENAFLSLFRWVIIEGRPTNTMRTERRPLVKGYFSLQAADKLSRSL